MFKSTWEPIISTLAVVIMIIFDDFIESQRELVIWFVMLVQTFVADINVGFPLFKEMGNDEELSNGKGRGLSPYCSFYHGWSAVHYRYHQIIGIDWWVKKSPVIVFEVFITTVNCLLNTRSCLNFSAAKEKLECTKFSRFWKGGFIWLADFAQGNFIVRGIYFSNN